MITDKQALVDAASRYLDLGLSVIPCNGKVASVNWKLFIEQRANRALVEAWARHGVLNNVGVICGAISRNLVVLDLDGDDAVQAFAEKFEYDDILDTWTVRSGSGHGLHVYWRVQHLPKTIRALGLTIGNVELRANGCYVVAPPSIHPATNKPYSVEHRAAIRKLHNLEPVIQWIKGLVLDNQKAKEAAHPASNVAVQHISKWAKAALDAECASVRRASAGRNNTLNRAAFKLGQLIASGKLDRATAEQALFDAAAELSADDGERATLATINSGIEAGMKKPR